MTVNLPVLVLNQNYEPVNICLARRALTLVYQGKAEMLENGAGFIHTTYAMFPIPSVIRLDYIVKRPRLERRLTRHEIFTRDQFTCQYCGKQSQQLTLDHVVPKYYHGGHSWENVVAACAHCNRKKAGRTPEQAGMKLLHQPVRPRSKIPFYIPYHFTQTQTTWQKYLPQ